MLKEIYLSKSTKIVLDCDKDKVMDVLKQAQQVGLVSEGYYYLITSLDAHTLNMDEFKVRYAKYAKLPQHSDNFHFYVHQLR